MTSLKSTYDLLIGKLRFFQFKEKQIKLAWGFIRFVLFSLSLITAISIFESLFLFGSGMRIFLFIQCVIMIFSFFIYYLVIPVIKIIVRTDEPPLKSIAMKLGYCYPDVNDQLANAIELYPKLHCNPENYSLSLIDHAVTKVSSKFENEDLNKNLDFTILRRDFRIACFFMIFSTFLWILFFTQLKPAIGRICHPLKNYASSSLISLTVFPGDIEILKGQDIKIRIGCNDPDVKRINLFIIQDSRSEKILLTRVLGDSFNYRIPEINKSIAYYASNETVRSNTYTITVIELPQLRKFQVKVEPPFYSSLSSFILDENVGDITALKGSLITISGESNKILHEGSIQFKKAEPRPLVIIDNQMKVQFRLLQDDLYSIFITDEEGRTNPNSIEYQLKTLPDQAPFIEIISPAKDIDLGEDMKIPLVLEVMDDYGISKIQIGYQVLLEGQGQIDSSGFSTYDLEGWNVGEDHLRIPFTWDINFELLPTDVLVYFAQAFDNDTASGPKATRTKIYRARFPSMNELYEELAKDQEDASQSAKTVYDKSLEVQQKIQNLSREMQRKNDLDWKKTQELKDALEKHQEIQKELDKLAMKINEMAAKMQKNQLVSSETIQKYQEMQKLYQDIMTPEIQDLLKKISSNMQNMDQKLLQKTMQELKISEEDIRKNIERTISLLKRLKLEQQLDQAEKLAKDLSQRQAKISDEKDKVTPDKRIFQEQQKISQDTEKLKDLLNELKQQMSDDPKAPMKEIENALSQINKDDFQSAMNDLMNTSILAGTRDSADKIIKTFDQITQHLKDAKDKINGLDQMKAIQALRQSSRSLLELSMEQEKVMQNTQNTMPNSSQYTQMTEEQNDLAEGLSRIIKNIYETSKQNFYIPQSIGQSLGEAHNSMQKALESLETRDGRQAFGSQNSAMASLNRSVLLIQSSLQNMMQNCSNNGGMSMEQFMGRLQKLADMQQGINEQTSGLGAGSQLSFEQQAAIARLAAGQENIRKSLEELAKEAESASNQLGNLEKLIDDMKQVEKDFSEQNVGRKTIERQNQILSRMLDAQKSIHEREFSQQRKAETARNYLSRTPPELSPGLGERQSRIQQDLLHAKKEGYTRDYLDLIERYFEVLSKSDQNQQ
jgi:hypothetical protein